jgi:hypothetical protein
VTHAAWYVVGYLVGQLVRDAWPWDMMGRLKPGRTGSIFSREARARHPRFWRLGWRARARARVAAEEEKLRDESEREKEEG